jgi:hypothetical protein
MKRLQLQDGEIQNGSWGLGVHIDRTSPYSITQSDLMCMNLDKSTALVRMIRKIIRKKYK